MSRREFPAKVKLAAWDRAKGHCERCRNKITRGVQYDHSTPDYVDGPPTLDNCVVLCTPCHSLKTTTTDAPAIAKTKRIRKRQAGVKRSKKPMPGSRDSGWKRRMDGTVERRE